MPGAHGAYILGCAGPELTQGEIAFFADADPWGFILFARNIDTPDQTRRLTDALRASVGRDAPVFIDQEGGRVQRFGPPIWRQYLPALDQVVGATDGPRALYLRSLLIAQELRDLGITGNCAPLGDIAGDHTHPVLRNRCYGLDADQVIAGAQAVVQGQSDGGLFSVLKHIPGHGRGTLDSHHDLPRTTDSADTLRATDFKPFKALNTVPLGMTAHVVYEAFDPHTPATCSPIMHQVIREEIGFQGLLMTDDISMNALSGTVVERSRSAIDAGCDVVLHCNGELVEMQAIAAEIGPMPARAQARADAALAAQPTPQAIDISDISVDLYSLMHPADSSDE